MPPQQPTPPLQQAMPPQQQAMPPQQPTPPQLQAMPPLPPVPPPEQLWDPPVAGPAYPVSGPGRSTGGSRRSGRPDHRRPIRVEVLIGVTLWRLVIVVFALVGLFAAIEESGNGASSLEALSQSASLLAAIVYGGLLLFPLVTGLRWHEPRTAWWRGATTVTLLLVAGVFLTMLSGDLSGTPSLFEHLLTPMIVLIDWCVVGRNQANTRAWTPLTWLCFPTLYLLYYNAADLELYESDFSLRFDNSDFMSYFPGFVAGLIVAGYALFLIGRVKASVAAQQEAMKRQSPTYTGGPPLH